MKDLIFNVNEGLGCTIRPGDDGGQYIVAFEGDGKDATMIVLKLSEGTWNCFKHLVKSEIEAPIRPKWPAFLRRRIRSARAHSERFKKARDEASSDMWAEVADQLEAVLESAGFKSA